MSDYLNTLAARSLKLIEVIRPRLASRYEPPDAAGGSASAQRIDTALTDEGSTSGEIDLSHQPPGRPSIEPPREARPPVSEFQRIPPDEAPSRADGMTAAGAISSVPPTHQQSPLPPQVISPPGERGSDPPFDHRAFNSTPPVALQTPPAMLEATPSQPSVRSGPRQPDQHRPVPSLAVAGEDRATRLSRRGTDPENHPRLEPALSLGIIEPIVLRQAPQPAGPANDTSGTLPRRSAAQENWPWLEPIPLPIGVERLHLRHEPRASGVGDGTEAASLQSTGQLERRPARPVAVQPIDVEKMTPLSGPPQGDASPPGLPPSQGGPSPRVGAIVVQPQVVPYVEPIMPAPLSELATAPEPAPTIQVTIGRIEVRATPPTGPARQRRATATPVMSLDEYLRQRARGGGG